MKKFILYFSLVVSLLLLVACGSETKKKEGDKTDANKVTTLTLWYYYTSQNGDVLNEQIDKFNKSQDKIKITSEYVPFPDIRKQLSVGASGDTLPDLVIMDSVDNASFSALGILDNITEKLKASPDLAQIMEQPLNTALYQDNYYGVPFISNALAMYYNQDIFTAAGIASPPKTWDELKEVSEKISQHDKSITPFGWTAAKTEQATFQFMPFLTSAGGTYDQLTSPAAIKALTFEKEMMDKGYTSKDFINSDQDAIDVMFSNSKLAMMISGPWAKKKLEAADQKANYAIASIPRDQKVASSLGGENITIIDNKNKDASWEFLAFLMKKENVEYTAEKTETFPIRKDVLAESDYIKTNKFINSFLESYEHAVPRGPSKDWPKISENIQNAIQNALTGEKSVEDALAEAQEKNEALK